MIELRERGGSDEQLARMDGGELVGGAQQDRDAVVEGGVASAVEDDQGLSPANSGWNVLNDRISGPG